MKKKAKIARKAPQCTKRTIDPIKMIHTNRTANYDIKWLVVSDKRYLIG